jgi:hypothetical protein
MRETGDHSVTDLAHIFSISQPIVYRKLNRAGERGERRGSVSSVVNAQTVTDAVASKRSSWMMTTGRCLPAYPLPAAAVQILVAPHSSSPRASMNA